MIMNKICDSSSGGDRVSFSYGSEDPEAIRAASEDGSVFKQPNPRSKSRGSDSFDLPRHLPTQISGRWPS